MLCRKKDRMGCDKKEYYIKITRSDSFILRYHWEVVVGSRGFSDVTCTRYGAERQARKALHSMTYKPEVVFEERGEVG
jgi:hypothetical protein